MASKSSKRPPAGGGGATLPSAAMTVGEKVAWVCLHLLVFLVPIAISNLSAFNIGVQVPTATGTITVPFTFDQFDIVKVFTMRAIILVALGGWLYHIFVNGGRIRFTRVEWVILLFLAWVTITTVFSIHPPTAIFGKYRRFEGLLSFLTYATVFFVALQVVDRASRARSLARTLAISGVLVSFYGVMQYLGWDPWTWGRLPFEPNRGFSFFGNPDLLGGFLIFPFAVTIGLALSERHEGWRATYWIFTIINVIAGITAFTRGSWIGATVALIAIIVAYLVNRKGTTVKLQPVDWGFVGVTLLGAVIVFVRSLSMTDGVRNVADRVVSIFQFDQGSALTRFQIWEAAIAATADRPILGFGADTFRLIFPLYKPAEYVQAAGYLSVADNVHNYPLQLTSALGIPGFLLLYGLFGYALYVSAKQVFVKGSGADRLVFVGLWTAALGYIVHLLFGLSVTGSTVFLWLAFGILLSPSATIKTIAPPSFGKLAAGAAIVVLGVLSVFNVRYIVADHHYMRARIVEAGITAIQSVDRAIQLNPYNEMYRLDRGDLWQKLFAQTAAEVSRLEANGQDASGARSQMRSAFESAEAGYLDTMEYAPYEYDTYVFLANLYNIGAIYLGDATLNDKSVEIGFRGTEVSQHGPAVRVQLALGLSALGRVDEALEQLEVATSLDSNFLQAWVLYGDILREVGRTDEARAAYEHVLERNPNFTTASDGLRQIGAFESTVTP